MAARGAQVWQPQRADSQKLLFSIQTLEQAAHSVLSATADCWKTTSHPHDYKLADNDFGAVYINESFTHLTLSLLNRVQFRFKQAKFHTSLCTWLSLQGELKFQNYSSNKTSVLAQGKHPALLVYGRRWMRPFKFWFNFWFK